MATNLGINSNLTTAAQVELQRPALSDGPTSPNPNGSGFGSDQNLGGKSGDPLQTLGKILHELAMLVEELQGGSGQGQSGPSQAAPGFAGNNGNSDPAAGFFTQASGSSTGDPHLGFDGKTGSGQSDSSKYDSMTGHDDLVDANHSFYGGYQVATTVTQANDKGITTNDSATVTTGFGHDSVTFNRDGSVKVSDNGTALSIAKGQSLELSSGATVSEGSDGKVTVAEDNGQGGKMSTTLSSWGGGVDVNFNGTNVALGGDLPNQDAQGALPQQSAPGRLLRMPPIFQSPIEFPKAVDFSNAFGSLDGRGTDQSADASA